MASWTDGVTTARRAATALPPLSGRTLAWLVPLLIVNSLMLGHALWRMAVGYPPVDWRNYVEASERFWSGGLYDSNLTGYAYHYSPVLAPVFGLLAPIGDLGWRLLHLVPAFLMPTRLLTLVVLVSWPFWADVESGNVMVFVLLAAAWAVHGSRAGALAFLVLTVLMPRPLMMPLAIWLLWKQPGLRLPFVAIFAVHLVAVVFTGWGAEWLQDLVAASRDVDLPANVAPSRFVGPYVWLAIGFPIAVWLTARDRPEWAGMFVQPYLIGYYLLLPLASLARRPAAEARPADEASAPEGAPPAEAPGSPGGPEAAPPAGR